MIPRIFNVNDGLEPMAIGYVVGALTSPNATVREYNEIIVVMDG